MILLRDLKLSKLLHNLIGEQSNIERRFTFFYKSDKYWQCDNIGVRNIYQKHVGKKN